MSRCEEITNQIAPRALYANSTTSTSISVLVTKDSRDINVTCKCSGPHVDKTFRSTCRGKIRYSRDLLGETLVKKTLLRDLQEAKSASVINVVLTAVKESRKKVRNYPTSSHILSLPLPIHIILGEPDHFLFNLVSVNGFSHIYTLTFIFSSGTFTLGHFSNSWLGFGETLQSLHCSKGRTNQGVFNTVK